MPEFIHSNNPQDTVFDVDAERLAGVYAQAALNAAGDVSAQESLVGELTSLVEDVLDCQPRLAELFDSRLIAEDEKLAMLDRLFGASASSTTLHVLKVLARHGRLGIVRDLVRTARKMLMKRSGRVSVDLETAHELDDALQQEILKSLGSSLGADPVVSHRVNPDLIAGFVVRVGDRVYDASIRTSLNMLARA